MPKVIDHDQRRREIIDATWGLIVRGGFEAATMREIAAEAGFANGALKHYFPGKDEIIEGAFQRALERTSEHVAERVADRQGVDALWAYVTSAMPMDAEAGEAARILLSFWEHGLANERLREIYQGHLDRWHSSLEALIAQCRADGAIRSATPDVDLAKELILMNMGATAMSVIGPQFATPAMLQRQIDEFFARLTRP